jgi:hypothetical protein
MMIQRCILNSQFFLLVCICLLVQVHVFSRGKTFAGFENPVEGRLVAETGRLTEVFDGIFRICLLKGFFCKLDPVGVDKGYEVHCCFFMDSVRNVADIAFGGSSQMRDLEVGVAEGFITLHKVHNALIQGVIFAAVALCYGRDLRRQAFLHFAYLM